MEQTPFPGGASSYDAGPPMNEEELERLRLREMLQARQRGPLEEAWNAYEQWGEEHPILRTGAEAALAATGEGAIAYGARLPGLVGSAARGLKWLEEHTGGGGREGWGGGRNIKDPKYRLNAKYKDDELAEYEIWPTKGDAPVGRLRFDYNPEKKQLYLGWAEKAEGAENLGTGQMMHIFRQVGEDFPGAETVRFYRIPNTQKPGGGTVGRKGYTDEVTLPLKRREKGTETEATREMFGRAVEQEQKKSRVVRQRITDASDAPDLDEDIQPDYNLIEMTPHEREIADLMESGGLEHIMHWGSERHGERARRLGSQEEALRVGDQVRDKALREQIEMNRQLTGREGPIPSFEEAYDTGMQLERRATMAAMQREEQRLTELLRSLDPGEGMTDPPSPLGRPLEHRVAVRHGYGTPEHYEQRSEIENVTPLDHAKVLHIARERGISEDEALDTYNAIQDRLMEDDLWHQTLGRDPTSRPRR